jgi:hypothetical protein
MDRMKQITSVAVVSLGLFLASAARADWWTNTDDRPRQVAPGVWSFSIKVPVQPVGRLQFVNAQYDFYDFASNLGTATNGMSVDYAHNGKGIDFTQDGTLFAVAPTLFEPVDGFIQGWSRWGIVNGRFKGTVYATARPLRVSITIVADGFVYGNRRVSAIRAR